MTNLRKRMLEELSLPTAFWISSVGRPSLLKFLRTALDPSDSSLTFTAPAQNAHAALLS
jgi:hypothetical protein